jgi:hypothetical protein
MWDSNDNRSIVRVVEFVGCVGIKELFDAGSQTPEQDMRKNQTGNDKRIGIMY